MFPTIASTPTWPTAASVALIWEGEPGKVRRFTFRQLHAEVCRFANVLRRLGVGKGDVAAIYMPPVPELAIAMLACAASARSTAWSPPDFPRKRSPTATTTPAQSC